MPYTVASVERRLSCNLVNVYTKSVNVYKRLHEFNDQWPLYSCRPVATNNTQMVLSHFVANNVSSVAANICKLV